MVESNIVFEAGNYWVACAEGQYTVYRSGATHSTADSSYGLTADGLSLAVCRARYLQRRDLKSFGGRLWGMA